MIIDTIDIIEPVNMIRKSKTGNTNILDYTLKNKGDFDLIDFSFDVYTVKKVGTDEKTKEDIFEKTSKNYSEILNIPDVIHPTKSEVVKVKIDIPAIYKETVKTDKGKSRRTPFRLHFGVHALEDIIEI